VVAQFQHALAELHRAVNEEDETSWTQAMERANRRISANKAESE
jgi:hypothetical protein